MVPGVCGGVGYPCSVVGVFEEDGVVLFNVRGGGVVDRHVLLHPGEKKYAMLDYLSQFMRKMSAYIVHLM